MRRRSVRSLKNARLIVAIAAVAMAALTAVNAAAASTVSGSDHYAGVAAPAHSTMLTAQTRTAVDASPADRGTGVSNTRTTKAILAYWTRERIRSATPEPIPAMTTQPYQALKDVLPPRSAPGGRPQQATKAAIPSAANDATALPAISRARRWRTQGKMPALTIGKIYYVRTNNTNGYCTGSVITARNKNTVWTSGHCIHKGSGGSRNYFRDFIFVPDADNGREPHGRWIWKYANTTKGWQDHSNWGYDIAAIAFYPQRRHGSLSTYLGSQGYKFGHGLRFQNIHAFGYPEDGFRRTDFTGNDLWFCRGATYRADGGRLLMKNDMFHGSSGGPWLQDLRLSRGWGYIIGANSHRKTDSHGRPKNLDYKSPNHGDAAINVHNDVSRR